MQAFGAIRSLALAIGLAVLGLAVAAEPVAAEDCVRANARKITTKVVSFDFDSSEIRPDAAEELNKIAERFATDPNVDVCLIGMTDRSGTQEYNRKLAMRRAESVADYLKEAGMDDSKFQLVAQGQTFSDDSWVGKLIGDSPRESARLVHVVLMEQ